MGSPSQPRIVRDSRDQTKLEVSLPGGRYQLSLDGRGERVLFDTLGYSHLDPVSVLVVCVLLVTGDAWFPNQRDVARVVADLPTPDSETAGELAALATYLRMTNVPRANLTLARDLVTETALADHLDPDEVTAKDLPDVPDDLL